MRYGVGGCPCPCRTFHVFAQDGYSPCVSVGDVCRVSGVEIGRAFGVVVGCFNHYCEVKHALCAARRVGDGACRIVFGLFHSRIFVRVCVCRCMQS